MDERLTELLNRLKLSPNDLCEISALLQIQNKQLIKENKQLKSLCEGVSADLSEIINREEGRLRPSARGDVDNARLTLLKASES